MPRLPARFAAVILAFAPLFVHRSWQHARVLLVGAILTPGRRTVASVLRITGRSHERRFVNYHRVLSRAAWCPRTGARTLLGLLVDAFVPSGPVILALDDTNERRWGRRIKGRGIYRDPVRSSDGHFVKTSGLPVVPIRWVLIRDPEHRFAPQALLCTDLARDPAQIVAWFVRRWCVEVTFHQEARAHLGVETQRQWSDKAVARTTPCLLALFSIVTLLAARLSARERRQVAAAAWYPKPQPTFSDALAAVRRTLWREQALATSPRRTQGSKRRRVLPAPWAYALCHAA